MCQEEREEEDLPALKIGLTHRYNDNNIISECSKLAQKEYKTRHDWVG